MALETNKNLPKELEIFYQTIQSFIPEGKTWNDLTKDEQEEVKNKYRFAPLKPGQYQNLSGFSTMMQ